MAIPGHLERAIEIAAPHRTHPNPRVGAVVVSADGAVLGEGSHLGPGQPHAEVAALDGVDARGATVFVTLEPCAHHGRTPPCVTALIEAGVQRVVVGAIDPDDRVAGQGVEQLRNASIDVEVLDAPEAEALDAGYFHQRRTGFPLVTLKYAMTIDGSIAAQDGSSQWITGELARKDAHALRERSDAVVVGAGTLAADDPQLTVRLDGFDGSQPRPVVVAGRSALDGNRAIWGRDPLVYSTRSLELPAGECVVVDGDVLPDPEGICVDLAGRGMYDVLIEGGPTLAKSFWDAGVIHRLVVFIGGLAGGGQGMAPFAGRFSTLADARSLELKELKALDQDLRAEYVRK